MFENNLIVGGIVIFLDITGRKRSEESLRQKHEMLKRTEAIAHVGSWEWEIETDTVTWSEELYRIFQLNPDGEAPNWAQHPKIYHPEDFEKLRQATETAIAAGKPYELELRAFRKDGETRICLAKGFPEIGKDRKVVRLFGLLQDITDQKSNEAALRERIKELNCLYGISHLVESGKTLPEILQGTADLVPGSWQYPQITSCRIVVEGRYHSIPKSL